MHQLKILIERYLLLWLVLLSGLAFYWNRLARFDVFSRSAGSLPIIIAITMFAIGWMLPRHEVGQVFHRWPTVFLGTATQYVAMPALAFLLARQFGYESSLLIGVIMVGCVPGAMASNVLTLTAGGNTSYSVSLTTTATLFSPIVVPLALTLTLGTTVAQDKILDAAVELSWMVVIPVVVGHLVGRAFPTWEATAGVVGSIIANLTILWIVAVVVARNRATLGALDPTLLLCLLLLNLLGYAAGLSSGKLMGLPAGMRRALTLEVGMQNAGLGTALVTSLFPDDPLVAVPPALYTFGCMLTGTVLARWWQSIPAEEPAGEP